MKNGRLFLLFHGRFPSEKAAAIFVMESAQAYGTHLPVEVIVPARRGTTHESLPKGVVVRTMPNIDLFGVPMVGAVAFPLSYTLFSFFSFLYLFFCLQKGDIVETNEVVPALFATIISPNTVYEMHDFPERALWVYRLMMRRVRFVLATNKWKAGELTQKFGVPAGKIIMERNGVDIARFAPQDKNSVRAQLGVPQDKKVVLYTGHLYGWKGVDTLAQAATLVPDTLFYFVGGTKYDVARFKEHFGTISNIKIMGHRPHSEVPLWQSAADVLVLPNTAKEELSVHYTSPMKLFEYMASGRPIVASKLPSIEEIIPAHQGYLVEPDSVEALVEGVREALDDVVQGRARSARQEALHYSWDVRAERLLMYLWTNH